MEYCGGVRYLTCSSHAGEPCWSFIARSADEVERFFKETVENRDEGIVLKDLGSKWEPSDRSGKWLKLKPEYIHPSSDLDVLIIGGYYGSGRHGGEVAQFLVGLAERPTPNTYPRRFVSFCRLGAGLSDDELGAVVMKLKPYFRKNDYPKKSPPSFYHVTNNSKERPDIWIDSPDKSIILSITSDIRTIRSEVFAAPYSLRFPRIDRVRFDKPWHECLDVQSFIELVHSSNGNTQRGTDYGGVRHTKPKRTRSFTREEKRNLSVVPSHLVQTDISGVKEDTLIFSNMIFYFVNVPTTLSLDSLHKMVVENGGAFSMNLTDSVTHCVAAESKGIKYQAAKLRGDIIHYPWLLDCCSQKKLLPLQPKYFLFLSDSRKKLQEEIDVFSDPYYCDIDLADIKQLLSNVKTSEDTKTINHYKKKYCPLDKWSHFNDCYIYFHVPPELKPDWEVLLTLAMKRLQIEVCMGGGNLTARLARATHLVVLSAPGSDVYFRNVLSRFTVADKRLIWNKRLQVVKSQWLEDCLEKEQRLQEEIYSLELEELDVQQWRCDMESDALSPFDCQENQNISSPDMPEKDGKDNDSLENRKMLVLPEPDNKRKQRRLAGRGTKKKVPARVKQPRRKPHRVGKPAKLSVNDSDESSSHDENISREETKLEEGDYTVADNQKSKFQETLIVKDFESPQKSGEGTQYFTREEQPLSKIPKTEMTEKHIGGYYKTPEKLEVMTDPVQAMLLDMIPSLGMTKTKTASSEDEPAPVLTEERQPEEPIEQQPVKKKKVSYKDVAGELLKDW